MTGFLVRRLANYVVLLFIATFLAYALASLTFDPLSALKMRHPPPPPSALHAKALELHLNQPIPERFLTWFGGVLHGDFGSTITDHQITDELGRRVGVSLRLFLLGTVVGVLIGVLIGVLGAVRQYKFSDYFSTFVSFVLLATPVFVIAPLLKGGALSINDLLGNQWLQFTGEKTPGLEGGFFATFSDRIRYLIVPTITIATTQVAYYSRYQRNAMLDVLGSDFLRTAQAKGLIWRKVLFRHGLRTALIPLTTLFAFGFGLLITGGVFTERIFGWFGMGDWLVTGVNTQDTNIVATVTLFIAVCVLVSGWLSDIVYAALDPRVRI